MPGMGLGGFRGEEVGGAIGTEIGVEVGFCEEDPRPDFNSWDFASVKFVDEGAPFDTQDAGHVGDGPGLAGLSVACNHVL